MRTPFSPAWHSVADLKPRLMPYAAVRRMLFRGEPWYVVQDETGGKVYRLTRAAYGFVTGMNGQTSVQVLWERANASDVRDACTQPEIVELLKQLHAADLLQADAMPDSASLLDRQRRKRSETIRQWLLNPMSLKIPLLNPDRFLTRFVRYVGWFFSPWGAALWLAVVLPALLLAGEHWHDLTENLPDRVLSGSNLLVMAAVYPVVKLAHELGHGFATKHWGGSVRELGLMFLIFAPVPYVEASSSSAFPSKYRRALVAAAGMLVELFLAAIALHVWLAAEPGVLRAVAFNVMVICGVSTLVVNGNPLLRYDGYYILSDLIEMPNMAQRGQAWWTWLLDRYAFGSTDAQRPPETRSEQRWLFFYTPLAWCYRTFVTVSVIVTVANKYFFVGALMALWSAWGLIGAPLRKAWKHLTTGGSLQRVRQRALQRTAGCVALVALVATCVPLPMHSSSLGVVWLPDRAMLHADGNGFFVHWLVPPGSNVHRGQRLYYLVNPQLRSDVAVNRAKRDQAQARFDADHFSDPTKAAISGRQLAEADETLARSEGRLARLSGYAGDDGTLVAATPQDMPGHYYKQGELIGYVLQERELIVRAVVEQDDIDLVHGRLTGVALRLADSLGDAWRGEVMRTFPGGVDELPTAALGLSAGGSVATNPNDTDGVKTLRRVFIIDLALPVESHPRFGERAHVRFAHGSRPLAWQGWLRLRQAFLSHFDV